MKRAYLIIPLLVLLLSACTTDSALRKIRLVPEPQLGNGVYRISGLEGSRRLSWSPTGDVLAGLIGVDPYPAPDCIPGPLACALDALFQPDFNSEIFLVDLSSDTRTRVLQTPTNGKIVSEVFWMPDGEHLGYVVNGIADSTDFGTWSIGIDGLDDRKHSDERILPVWSPDGKQFAEAGLDSIRIGTVLGGDEQEVFRSQNSKALFRGLSWSGDGTKIAFSYGQSGSETPELRPKIYLLDVSTRAVSQIPGDRFEQYRYPVFSPTNHLLVYEREQPAFFKTTTVVKDLETDCQFELPFETLGWQTSWSPDGSKLLVLRAEEHQSEYYIIDLKEFLGPKFATTGSICP